MLAVPIPIALSLPPPKTARSAGVHLSSIIRSLAITNGILKTSQMEDLSLTDVRDITDPDAVLRICLGLAWEEWYVPQLAEKMGVIDHPGEMHVDGIYMTHDGESVDIVLSNAMPVVHEMKLTWKSCGPDFTPTGQWMWMAQMMGYCRALGTTVGYLHVYFVCGDYRPPSKPMLRCWQIEFEPYELEANWSLMVNHMKHKQQQADEAEDETRG